MEKNLQNLPVIVQTAITNQKIDLAKVNFIKPTETYGDVLNQYEKVIIEVVKVDPKDVFEIATGKNVLSKRPLLQIANALGILWKPIDITTDIKSESRKSLATVTGAMKKPNGEWVILSDEKTVDLDVIEEEQRIKQEEYAKNGKLVGWEGKRPIHEPWSKHGGESAKKAHIEMEVRKAVLPYWKFKDERAITGAQERVIRKFVALKDYYTLAELSRPLAFPRVVTDTAKMLEDPKVRQAAIERMTGSVKSIFGHSPEATVSYEVQNGEKPKQIEEAPAEAPAEETDEVPFSPEPEKKKSPEEEEIEACKEELKTLSGIDYLSKDAKAFAIDLIDQDSPNLDALTAALNRIKEWLNDPRNVQKHGRYEGAVK